MRTTGVVAVVVIIVVGSVGCFSTARYDDAHLQRVAIIHARYAAEGQRVDQQYASYITALDKLRMELIPMTPGMDVPVSRIVDREDLVLCRRQCAQGAPAGPFERQNEPAKTECFREVCRPASLDALRKTYFRANVTGVMSQPPGASDADLEAVMARSHNREVRRTLDDQTRSLAQQRAQAQRLLARQYQVEIDASEHQRTSEIASGRAVRRARLKAADDAFTAMGQGPISARQRCVGAIDDQLLSRVGDCPLGAGLLGGAASLQSSPPPGADQPAARR
jgi:hypothetical protein